MAVVLGFLGAVWSYGVSLPLHVTCGVVAHSVRALSDFIWPRGYKPCNELADAYVKECAARPVGHAVLVPWGKGSAVSRSGRLLSYLAIGSGRFGVAVKTRGQGFSMERTYRYYYRRNLTGNWFAEIWSVPKSGLISAALAIPFVDIARDVMRGSTFVKTDYFSIGQQMELQGHEGLMLLVSGLLLVACFLPRAILGRDAHFAAIAMIQPGGLAGYGCAQVINWGAAMAGLSYLWLAAGQSWEVDAVVRFVTADVMSVVENIFAIYAQSGLRIMVIPLVAVVGATFGMAWTIIPAAAFWYISLRFMSARKAKAKLEVLPFNSLQAAMYIGSDFERLAEIGSPQITLGYLIYCGALVGIILYPISSAIANMI